MYDDTVKTLSDVRHVLELKKNLISLGVLDSNGYKFTGQNGVLKVSKGALVVIKAEKVGNLYRLKGSTQVNEAMIVSEKVEEGFRLWHQWLGHMSKKGLQVLMNRKLLPDLKSLKLDFVNIVCMENNVNKGSRLVIIIVNKFYTTFILICGDHLLLCLMEVHYIS